MHSFSVYQIGYIKITNKINFCDHLNLHLSACESYECDYCYFIVKQMTDIKDHMEETHDNENFKIIHGKVDRKNENFIKTTEHLRFDLFA